jgi:hypothetical protein
LAIVAAVTTTAESFAQLSVKVSGAEPFAATL